MIFRNVKASLEILFFHVQFDIHFKHDILKFEIWDQSHKTLLAFLPPGTKAVDKKSMFI